jgi:hypothetical protein
MKLKWDNVYTGCICDSGERFWIHKKEFFNKDALPKNSKPHILTDKCANGMDDYRRSFSTIREAKDFVQKKFDKDGKFWNKPLYDFMKQKITRLKN